MLHKHYKKRRLGFRPFPCDGKAGAEKQIETQKKNISILTDLISIGFREYSEFFKIVLDFLSHEGIRHAGVFRLKKAIAIPGISATKTTALLASVWYEIHSGSPKIFFKTQVGQAETYDLSQIPFEYCDQIAIFPENPQAVGKSRFMSYPLFVAEVHSLLAFGKKKRLEFNFGQHIYIPEISLTLEKTFTVWASIESIDNCSCKNKTEIVIYRQDGSVASNDLQIIPYLLCTDFKALDEEESAVFK